MSSIEIAERGERARIYLFGEEQAGNEADTNNFLSKCYRFEKKNFFPFSRSGEGIK